MRARVLALLLLASIASAEPIGAVVAVTATSATTTLSRGVVALALTTGDGTTENTVPVACRIFTDADTVAAAVFATSPIRIAPGEAHNFRHDPRTSSGTRIVAFACITAAAAANIRYEAD